MRYNYVLWGNHNLQPNKSHLYYYHGDYLYRLFCFCQNYLCRITRITLKHLITRQKKDKYMGVTCVQDIYRCDTCKSASDEYGRSCKHGILFPLLLVMRNCRQCENYEFDPEKVKLHLQRKDKKL